MSAVEPFARSFSFPLSLFLYAPLAREFSFAAFLLSRVSLSLSSVINDGSG